MWLRDFIPAKLPKARILLYGYNSNVAFEASAVGIVAHAGNLLNWLIVKRRVGLVLLFIIPRDNQAKNQRVRWIVR